MAPTAVLTRRQLLAGLLGAGAAAGLAACTRGAPDPVRPPQVATGSTRPTTGAVRSYQLTARQVDVDLGGRVVPTWAYGDTVPGTPIRATAGDLVRVAFGNDLPAEILRFAKFENVTQIVIGRSRGGFFAELFRRSLPHELIRRVEDMAGFLGTLYNRDVTGDDLVTVIRFSEIRG